MNERTLQIITFIGMILFLVGVIVVTIAYYTYNNNQCIADPVAYANNNSENYWWDGVYAIKLSDDAQNSAQFP